MLPRAVREQAERSDRILQEMLNGNTPAPAVAPEATETVDQVPAPVEATPAPAPAATTEPSPPPTSQTPDSWELKYRVLNGKYTAEVPRLHAEVKDLKAKVEALTAQLESKTTSTTPDSVREQYGDDFAAAVDAVATSRVEEVVKKVDTQLSEVRDSAQKMARAEFMRQLTGLVPNVLALDGEAGFTAYLDEFDPMTGRVRREFFNEADASNDAARIATFYLAYARSKQPQVQSVATPPAPPPEPMLTPDASRSSSAPPAKKIWTNAEINQFYRVAKPSGDGKFGPYTYAQYAAIDADITAAGNEGRIRG